MSIRILGPDRTPLGRFNLRRDTYSAVRRRRNQAEDNAVAATAAAISASVRRR